MKKIAEREAYTTLATIEDPAALETIETAWAAGALKGGWLFILLTNIGITTMLLKFDFTGEEESMDAFEQVVSQILWREGFWAQTSVKVELTKEDKAAIGRKTSPRWELDVVGYRPRDNLLWVVECKSLLDSRGVGIKWLDPQNLRAVGRMKMFSEPILRRIVLNRLKEQFVAAGLCRPSPQTQLCLASGKMQPQAREQLLRHFKKNKWILLDAEWLRRKLKDMSDGRYENQVSAVVAKILMRGASE